MCSWGPMWRRLFRICLTFASELYHGGARNEVATVNRTCLPLVVGSLLSCLPTLASAQTNAPASTTELPPPPPPLAPPLAAPPPPSPPPPAWAAPPPPPMAPPPSSVASPVELMTLRLMREKGILSAAEYDSALNDLSETAGTHAPSEGTVVLGKWATTLYGFVDVDSIWDSTRSLNDLEGTTPIVRPLSAGGTVQGENARFTFGARNSRIGVRMKAPEWSGVRSSAQLEMDFLGTQLPVGNGQPYFGTEAALFTNPTFRIRHMNFKVETPVVDILMGQYWQLFGWQPLYQPNTVELQGVPGELYARTPQLRISKTVKAYPVTFEIAIAGVRSVQRDNGFPDGEGGVRLSLDSWTGVQTVGQNGTQISPLSIAATGLVRRVSVNSEQNSKVTNERSLSAAAVDAFVPLLPGTKQNMQNSLSIHGELTTGYGDADMFTGLTGGMTFPTTGTPPAAFIADIDPGIVTYDANGGLHGIQWTTYLLGLQYYLPGLEGKAWITGNYSHIESSNIATYAGTAGAVSKATAFDGYDWFDAMLFVRPIPPVLFGLEYANFNTKYADDVHAINHRVQLSGFFIF